MVPKFTKKNDPEMLEVSFMLLIFYDREISPRLVRVKQIWHFECKYFLSFLRPISAFGGIFNYLNFP